MSRKPSERRVPLKVRAGSPATEIFVSDSSFRRIASGVDSLELEVPPGFYKVRFRVGKNQRDQLVEVPASGAPVEVEGEPVSYETAAPISARTPAGARDADLATRLSRTEHVPAGEGSQIMVLVRDLEPAEGGGPWKGVSLMDLEGEVLAELDAGDCDPGGAYAGLNTAVDPGTYRLRVDTSPLGVYEMFLVASPGWQTQVFALADDFVLGGARVRRAALRSTSVLMAREGRGFDPEAPDLRLADLARIALGAGREIASKSDQEALEHGKFDDPMLGIYGAHLLLLAPRLDHELIEIMIRNLRDLLGTHPDVEALELRSGASSQGSSHRFETPPMLRSSWDLIVRGSHRRVSLVPPGSVTDRIGDNVVSSTPWLLHRVPDDSAAEGVEAGEEEVSFAQGRRLLEKLARRRGSGELRRKVESLAQDRRALSTVERGLLKAALTQSTSGGEESLGEAYGDPSAFARQTAAQAIRSVDAPASTIARASKSLLTKLDLDFDLED